jgi:hypothetical protein
VNDETLARAQRYAYVEPDEQTLKALRDLGPLVEIGAGTGYWASRLREIGADIIAFDQAPPDGERSNRYHGRTPTWTEVLEGDQSVLAAHSDRALFLCWPPLFSSLAECTQHYTGATIAIIGDGGHRTARLQNLRNDYALESVVPARALDPMPGFPATLSIWRRRSPD